MRTEGRSEGQSQDVDLGFFVCLFPPRSSHSPVLADLSRLRPGLFTTSTVFAAAVLPSPVTRPLTCCRLALVAASLSVPLSVIHASVSRESRRTEPCRCLGRTAGVFLAQERSQQELHAAVRRCFALVNSSLSEGMSAAILEVNIRWTFSAQLCCFFSSS